MSNCYIDRDQIQKIDIINIKGGLTANQVYTKYKPDYFMNLALYDMSNGENITFLEDENQQSGYLFSNKGIGIKNNIDLLWTTVNDEYASKEIKDFVSGSPTLVQNGVKTIDWGNKYSSYVDGKHKRSFFGFNDKQLILCSSDNSLTLSKTADTAIQLGCKFAINCDGGGSCHLQMGSNVLKKSTRKNASWLLVYLKKNETEVLDMATFKNNSSKSLPVYETTACKKKIGSLDPYEECTLLYEDATYRVVMYNITGKTERKVGFVKK